MLSYVMGKINKDSRSAILRLLLLEMISNSQASATRAFAVYCRCCQD